MATVDNVKVPCKIRKGTSGSDYYYWDGTNPMITFAGSGAGSVLNALAAAQSGAGTTMKVFDLSVADFTTLQNWLKATKNALDSLADCQTCPAESDVNDILAELFP